MNAEVDAIIAGLQDELIAATRQAIRLKSVRGPAGGPGAPFGADIARCLEYVLGLARDMGFSVKNLDGYAGIVDYDCGGSETLGVLCHLDVVPEGTGWTYDPFGAELAGGHIFGRGALDDKGPTLSSLYALWAIKRAGLPLRRNVRIILGCDEETSWQCMRHYEAVEPLPDLAVSPDAEYPLIWSEKGILQAVYAKQFPSRITVEAGTLPNVVPGEARCRVPLSVKAIELDAAAVEAETGCAVTLRAEDGGALILVRGAPAHASTPERGKNAATALLELLARLSLGADSELAGALAGLFHGGIHGQNVGIDRADGTGRTTLNLGILHWDETGIQRLSLDARCPLALPLDTALAGLDDALFPLGFGTVSIYQKALHMVPRDSELVTKLLDVYERRAGERLPPLAIGGGTYARAIKNAVGFGCERPGADACMHMPDEHISVEDMMFNTYMLADAILALAD